MTLSARASCSIVSLTNSLRTVSFSPWTSSARAYPHGVIFWDMFNTALDCHVSHSGTCKIQISKGV